MDEIQFLVCKAILAHETQWTNKLESYSVMQSWFNIDPLPDSRSRVLLKYQSIPCQKVFVGVDIEHPLGKHKKTDKENRRRGKNYSSTIK